MFFNLNYLGNSFGKFIASLTKLDFSEFFRRFLEPLCNLYQSNEPTVEEVEKCVESTESKDSGCVQSAVKEPKRTTSEDSTGKESQATTGMCLSNFELTNAG